MAIVMILGLWSFSSSSVVEPPSLQAANFNANDVIPGWDQSDLTKGDGKILGKNEGGSKISLIKKNGKAKSVLLLVPKILEMLNVIVFPLVIVMTIWAGILFITAGGDDESISQSKRYFMYSVMGFIFVLISFTMVKIASNILT